MIERPRLIPQLVNEEFEFDQSRISRTVHLNGLSGVSVADIDETLPPETSRDEMTSIWDKAFLTGGVRYPSLDAPAKAIRIGDLFCGGGGLSYGVSEAIRACGLQPIHMLAADYDPVAMQVYRRNFDPIHFSTRNLWTSVTRSYSTQGEVTTFSLPPSIVNDELEGAVGKVDILVGGPPCEGHSSSNNVTRGDDPRNLFYIVMPAMAVALGAKVVIVENVPRIRNDKGKVLNIVEDLFHTNGYQTSQYIADLTSLGLPQTRKRHILVASTGEEPAIKEIMSQVARPSRDLRWVIGDLLDIESQSPMDDSPELSEVNNERINFLFDNGEYDLPNEWRPDSHKDGHTYPSIYGRLHWEKPSGTITTGFNTPGRGRYIHPEKRRTITAHEAARIQGFPDNFEFLLPDGEMPSRSSLADMIGDAVPPQLGYAAALVAMSTLDMNSLSGY